MTDAWILLTSLAIASLLLSAVRRYFSPDSLRHANDITGYYSGIIGTVYAVLLAFLLANVWELFRAAQVNANEEADSLITFYREAQVIEPPFRTTLSDTVENYARVMVDQEWPAMARGEITPDSKVLVDRMWRTVNEIKPATSREQIALDHMLTSLSDFVRHRRLRELQCMSAMPGIMWIVLVAGGAITVGFSCLFGVESFRRHLVQTMLLTGMIALVLIAIAQVDRPYQGGVQVSSEGFKFLLDTLARYQAH